MKFETMNEFEQALLKLRASVPTRTMSLEFDDEQTEKMIEAVAQFLCIVRVIAMTKDEIPPMDPTFSFFVRLLGKADSTRQEVLEYLQTILQTPNKESQTANHMRVVRLVRAALLTSNYIHRMEN